MIVVFSFLVLLLIIIHISAKLLRSYTKKEELSFVPVKPPGVRTVQSIENKRKLTAIISAAIAAHKKRVERNASS